MSATEVLQPGTITVGEIAERMGIPEKKVYRLLDKNFFRGAMRAGRAWIIPRKPFEAWLRGEKTA